MRWYMKIAYISALCGPVLRMTGPGHKYSQEIECIIY